MLIPAVIFLTCLSYSGCEAVQKSETVKIVYGDNFQVELKGGMELKCDGSVRFRCTESGNGKISWNTTEVLKHNDWAIDSSECDWCMKCDQSSCPSQTLDCTDPEQLDQNSRHDNQRCKIGTSMKQFTCKSIPVLMNTGCKEQGCIGHKEKTSVIQMYKQPTCGMSEIYLKLRMKIFKQSANRDHIQTVIFSDDGTAAGAVATIKIEYKNCGQYIGFRGGKGYYGCDVRVW